MSVTADGTRALENHGKCTNIDVSTLTGPHMFMTVSLFVEGSTDLFLAVSIIPFFLQHHKLESRPLDCIKSGSA